MKRRRFLEILGAAPIAAVAVSWSGAVFADFAHHDLPRPINGIITLDPHTAYRYLQIDLGGNQILMQEGSSLQGCRIMSKRKFIIGRPFSNAAITNKDDCTWRIAHCTFDGGIRQNAA